MARTKRSGPSTGGSGCNTPGNVLFRKGNYIIPIPPGIPPPPIDGAFLSGLSATRHSVVITNEAIEAAFCNAARVTFAGSMIPESIILTYWALRASYPYNGSFASTILFLITSKLIPAFAKIADNGASHDSSKILAPVKVSSLSKE